MGKGVEFDIGRNVITSNGVCSRVIFMDFSRVFEDVLGSKRVRKLLTEIFKKYVYFFEFEIPKIWNKQVLYPQKTK